MIASTSYSLWLEPGGDIAYRLQERIKSLSKKYNTPLFEPHVTLLGGLSFGKTKLISLTNTLAASLEPFQLTLTKAGYTKEFYQALFIYVKETNQLKNIRSTACRLFDVDNKDFSPHLSLIYGQLSQQQKGNILNITGREFYTKFDAKSLILMQTEGEPDQWNKVHTAVFKPNN